MPNRRETHFHTIGYIDSIIKYLDADIADAKEKLGERVRGSDEWIYQQEKVFGYESSKRYLLGAREMAVIEQRWNREDKEKR